MLLPVQIEAARGDGHKHWGFVPVQEAERGHGRNVPASRLPLSETGGHGPGLGSGSQETPTLPAVRPSPVEDFLTLNTHNSHTCVFKEALPFGSLLVESGKLHSSPSELTAVSLIMIFLIKKKKKVSKEDATNASTKWAARVDLPLLRHVFHSGSGSCSRPVYIF